MASKNKKIQVIFCLNIPWNHAGNTSKHVPIIIIIFIIIIIIVIITITLFSVDFLVTITI